MAAPSASERPPGAAERTLAAMIQPTSDGDRDTTLNLASREFVAFVALRVLYVALALAIFVLALELLTSGASSAESGLSRLAADGPTNLFGFGWLGAYLMLSGSPVAATSLSLFNGGAISDLESFAMITGSRFGASFMVLLIGFVYYIRHQRNPDGLYIGVVALLTTFTIYTPSLLIGLVALDQGWFDSISVGAPPGLATAIQDTVGVVADRASDALPGLLVFVLGAGALLVAFQLFDRVLPHLGPPGPGSARRVAAGPGGARPAGLVRVGAGQSVPGELAVGRRIGPEGVGPGADAARADPVRRVAEQRPARSDDVGQALDGLGDRAVVGRVHDRLMGFLHEVTLDQIAPDAAVATGTVAVLRTEPATR